MGGEVCGFGLVGGFGDGHEGLEVGFVWFAIDDGGVDIDESGFFEHVDEIDFGEAEPDVGVEFACFFELVFEEVEDEDAAVGAEDAACLGEGAFGVDGVVEGLAEDSEVDGGIVEGDVFDIAEAVFEVFDMVIFREAGAEFDHAFGVIDGENVFCFLGEELAEGAFAGAEVGDDHWGEELEEGFAEAFP